MNSVASEMQTRVLDHHGLIAAQCKDFKIAERVDALLKPRKDRIVSYGTAAVAMILNGLGFTGRPTYLTPQFFSGKPVDLLLGKKGLCAEHLNDDALGDALDAIAEYGPSKLFSELTIPIAFENSWIKGIFRCDTTSLSVYGEYHDKTESVTSSQKSAAEKESSTEGQAIKITHGHSKEYRPDLKQAVLSIAMAGNGGIPIGMFAHDGNASDKKILPETIERINAFCRQLDPGANECSRWVTDSSLYSEKNLQRLNDVLWVSRVPENITAAHDLINKSEHEISWKPFKSTKQEHEENYRFASFSSNYGGIKQRWILVFSQRASDREKKLFNKYLIKKEEELQRRLCHFENRDFSCERDAQLAFKQECKKISNLFLVTAEITAVKKHVRSGRPKLGEEKSIVGYKVQTRLEQNQTAIAQALNSKGRFILASNDLDSTKYPDEQILRDYKEQQIIERGFRFLKNPEFGADTLFLKSPERIAALMMIMTLGLFIYNAAQFQLRCSLQAKGEAVPNQVGKKTDQPTLRWIFQLMESIALVLVFDEDKNLLHGLVSNLNPTRKHIIQLFGPSACEIYGISI